MPAEVVELRAGQTHPLRRSELRDGTASDVVEFDGDELDSTFHLGALLDGRLVAISTWIVRPYPDRPADPGYQVRGMATEPVHRGEGLGALLLEQGIERCRERGARLVWARARDTTLEFYRRFGFDTVGLGYVDLTTGLPHHDIIRELDR